MQFQQSEVELQGVGLVVGMVEDLGDAEHLAAGGRIRGPDTDCEHLYVLAEKTVVVLSEGNIGLF